MGLDGPGATARSDEVGRAFCGGLLGCSSVEGGPTGEQRRVIDTLGQGLYGMADVASIRPLAPDEVGALITDHKRRHRLVEMMILLEFACHPAHPAMAESVERYADVLGVQETMLVLGRDALERRRERLQADYDRFSGLAGAHAESVENPELAARLRSLGDCAPATLGRAFYDFYLRYDLPFPGEPGGPAEAHQIMHHDFAHVIAGYEPLQIDELALQGMLVAATDGDEHFNGLVAVLGLSEVGMLEFAGAQSKSNLLMRPGAPEALAHAMHRGRVCGVDLEAVDHLAMVDEPLTSVRRELKVEARKA